MKWVTKEKAKVERIACPWLIKNFIDRETEFLFVSPEKVLSVAEKEKAISFDAPNAKFTHQNNKCTFEILVMHYKIKDPAILKLAKVVHDADISKDIDLTGDTQESSHPLRV